jgi:hypothetical protein
MVRWTKKSSPKPLVLAYSTPRAVIDSSTGIKNKKLAAVMFKGMQKEAGKYIDKMQVLYTTPTKAKH